MIYTCPDEAPADVPGIFIAGGITGCPDWQAGVIDLLPHHVTAYNPRRPNFPFGDDTQTPIQIAWETRHMRIAVVQLVWFCEETVQPMTMFELGVALGAGWPLAVGAHPGYERRRDVKELMRQYRSGSTVADTMPKTVARALSLYEVTAADRLHGPLI